MQQIYCHECNQETFFNKQLIGGEVRICLDKHRGIYDSNLKFIRPAPNLDYDSPFSDQPIKHEKDTFKERQEFASQKSKNYELNTKNYDPTTICFYCKDPTYVIEKDLKIDLKCNGCNGQGYYYDESKNSDFICEGCNGEGAIKKSVEKRSCKQEHFCFYSKGKFIKSDKVIQH